MTITELAERICTIVLSGTPTGGGNGPKPSSEKIKTVATMIRRFVYGDNFSEIVHG